jgi:hypothetical protein
MGYADILLLTYPMPVYPGAFIASPRDKFIKKRSPIARGSGRQQKIILTVNKMIKGQIDG